MTGHSTVHHHAHDTVSPGLARWVNPSSVVAFDGTGYRLFGTVWEWRILRLGRDSHRFAPGDIWRSPWRW